MPRTLPEDVLTREQRLALARRGAFMPAITGEAAGTFYNPARIAGQQPEGAGEVDPNYSERLAAREEARRQAMFQGAPESPAITAMRQQTEASWAQSRATTPQMPVDTRPIITGMPQFVGPIGPGGRTMGTLAIQGGIGGAERGMVAPQPTPQQQAQNWADVNTAANAEIVPEGGQSSAAPAFNLFGGGGHLDTALLAMGRDTIPKDIWDSYRIQTREADKKLSQALAGRAAIPHTIEEAQQFIASLGFDDRVGEHVERAMTRYMQNANPELYRQIVGEQASRQANDSSYVQWVKRNATDPAIARATSAEIMARQTPESKYAFETDLNASHYDYDPTTGKPALRPERKLTPIEQAQEDERVVDATIKQSKGLLQKSWKGGKPQPVSVEEVRKDRLEEVNKLLDQEDRSVQRNLAAYQADPTDAAKVVFFNKNARHTKNIETLEQERNQLMTGGVPAVSGTPATGLPVMTAEEVRAAPAGTRFTDDKGRIGTATGLVSVAGAPPRGTGSVAMGGETITTEDLAAQRAAVSSIMMGGKTVAAPVRAPAVQPKAGIAPYVTPITKVQGMLAREPAMPKPAVTPMPIPEISVSDEEAVQFLKDAVTGALGEIGGKISQGAETAARLPGKALSKLLSIPYKAEQYIETLGISGYNRLLEYGRQKAIEQKREAGK